MEYCIVRHWDKKDFEKEVNDLLFHGWDLHGGLVVTVTGNTNTMYFIQALIKK